MTVSVGNAIVVVFAEARLTDNMVRKHLIPLLSLVPEDIEENSFSFKVYFNQMQFFFPCPF